MSKLDELSDEHDYENPNPAIKKSFKSSFLSNFKSGKSKIISKLSSSPTSLDDTKCKSKQFDHEIGDLDSSLYYPVSSSSTLNNDSAETRKILRKTKTIRHKPVVNAFLKNSSFSSSSTSTSPPSPFSVHKNRRNKISKPSLTDLVNIPDTLDSSLDIQSDKESEDKKSFFNSSIETQNSFEQNKTKHRNMESGKSKLAKNVCSGSSHSKNELFNSDYDEEDFMDAFRIFDINGDGKITAKELKNVLKELGIKIDKNDVKKMIKELDKDGNGTIEYSGNFFFKQKLNYINFKIFTFFVFIFKNSVIFELN